MKLGSEVFFEQHATRFKGMRLGLLTNFTGVNHRLESSIDLFANCDDVQLTALFGPEHGIRGEVQEGALIESSTDPHTQLPIFSLYNKDKKPNREMLAGVDAVLCDLQDIGTRYYTFIYTMANLMQLCKEEGKRFIVLDRPNPINGLDIEGSTVEPEFSSFVGQYPIPVRHGLTIGELAMLFNAEFGIQCELEIIPMEGWQRDMYFEETGLYWVPPTPNSTGIDMCLLYPGTCLLEGTNISEGRGTTKPFEVIGAPFINGRKLARELSANRLSGVELRPTVFKPMFQKFAGEVCEGVQFHISDRDRLQSYENGITLLAVIRNMYGDKLEFIKSPDFQNRFFLDLLAGTDSLRQQLTNGNGDFSESSLLQNNEHYREIRKKYLLY